MRAGPGGPSVTVVTDPRIAPVEDNLESFFRTVASEPELVVSDEPDVLAFSSAYAFPLMNAICGARFAPGTVERRAREVVAPFLERGLPFIWWTTPSGHAEELGPVLTDLGMQCSPAPGMHAELTDRADPRAAEGVEVREVDGAEELAESLEVMLEGFEFPEPVRPVFRRMERLPSAKEFVEVTAWLDGQPVGCGTGWVTGETAGLYNITTLERARRRGIGYAVTATLMNAARERGAREVILHASEAGYPVYRRLGFEVVCQVPQFVWMPPDVEADADPPAEPETTVI
jgi:ribosomal protein S18 acetylase RimI-like enzyme